MGESFVFLAEGFEEMEAIVPVDLLRRAGIAVKTVSITNSMYVTGAHGIIVKADLIYDSVRFESPRWLIFPGGMPGAKNLHEFAPIESLIKKQLEDSCGRIAAICASPAVVLGQIGLLEGRRATCYPGFESLLKRSVIVNEPVVSDDKFVLANGPGNAILWALEIIAQEVGEDEAEKVADGLLVYSKSKNDKRI